MKKSEKQLKHGMLSLASLAVIGYEVVSYPDILTHPYMISLMTVFGMVFIYNYIKLCLC